MKITRSHVWATILVAVGVALTIYLGVLSGADQQPSRATSALLVVLAGVFQVAGASRFHAIGKADPGLARAAVRRLLKMVRRAQEAKLIAETAYESNANAGEMRKAMGRVSVELSWIEEGLVDSIDDWNEFHKDALRKLTEGGDNAK
ncbi:hypothetical protein [Sphaerimonospora thailandensis]|uniref:Uncharacterized protein n=1 Tax=Sphaerimonospora thailandensis TaxID=795644 RepID=A0A8J3REG6_9ACTN|nr:hypothetical protein [Sphaerimonospora thailandensis]GIH73240.1 hypothetical protein Mth01_54930 [Sphaerimonospora thailandensis]